MNPDGFGRKIRLPWSDLTRVDRISAKAVEIVGNEVVLDNGSHVNFTMAIVATGAITNGYPFIKGGGAPTLKDRESEFLSEGDRIKKAQRFLLIGGGPVGVEFAGEIISAYPEKKVTLVNNKNRLLPMLPDGAGTKAFNVLTKLGINIELNKTIALTGKSYKDQNDHTYEADLIFNLIGIKTTSVPVDGDASRNGLNQIKVDTNLRVIGRNNVFAIGDVNDVSEIKLGANAMSHAAVVAKNIIALQNNPHASLRRYKAAKPMGFVTLGPKAGIGQMPFGRMDFLISMKQKDLFLSMFLKRI
jgi:NADH dehydrogenase FAD-containing subunit